MERSSSSVEPRRGRIFVELLPLLTLLAVMIAVAGFALSPPLDSGEGAFTASPGRIEGIAELVTPLFPDPLPRDLHFEVRVTTWGTGRAAEARVETFAPAARVRFVQRREAGIVVGGAPDFHDARPLSPPRPLARRLGVLLDEVGPLLYPATDREIDRLEVRLTPDGARVTCGSIALSERRNFRFDARDRLVTIEGKPL